MLLRHSFFVLMPGIKVLGWKVPDCPEARIIKIEIIVINNRKIEIIVINVMNALYMLSISIFIKFH